MAEISSLLIYLTVIVKHTWSKEVEECYKDESNIKIDVTKKADKQRLRQVKCLAGSHGWGRV